MILKESQEINLPGAALASPHPFQSPALEWYFLEAKRAPRLPANYAQPHSCPSRSPRLRTVSPGRRPNSKNAKMNPKIPPLVYTSCITLPVKRVGPVTITG